MKMKKHLLTAICGVLAAGILASSVLSFPVWRGDADGNETINAKDVSLLLKYVAGQDVTPCSSADFNSDGNINSKDISSVLKYVAGWNIMNDDLLEAKYGVCETYFEIPAPETDVTVTENQFGFDENSDDNTQSFTDMIQYLRENPGTKVVIPTGTYKMNPSSSILFSGIKDCIVDGNGSVFIFRRANFFTVSGTENFKICNYVIDWDQEYFRTVSMVRVKSVEPSDTDGYYNVEYEFYLLDDATYAMSEPWDSMIYYDPDDLTPTVFGAGDIFNFDTQTIEKTQTAKNIIVAKTQSHPAVGSTLLIRHANYGSPAFNIIGNSANIVIENLTIYSIPGGGIYVNGGAHHVRMSSVTIGLNPNYSDTIRMSTTCDAMHIKETKGYFILEDCDIGFNGDDCLNVHDTVGTVKWTDGNTLVVHSQVGFGVGHHLSFKSTNDFSDIDFECVVESVKYTDSLEYTLTVDRNCDDDLEEGMIILDDDVDSGNMIIRNCYFHENRARGLLLGSDNITVENCRFYHIQQSAINIPVDITETMWTEGKGANNIIIRNCEFNECNFMNTNDGAFIAFVASNDYNKDNTIIGKCFSNILISGNKFINPLGLMIRMISAENVTVYGNTVEYLKESLQTSSSIKNGGIKVLGTAYNNLNIINNTWYKSEFMPDGVLEFTVRSSKLSVWTNEGNMIQ